MLRLQKIEEKKNATFTSRAGAIAMSRKRPKREPAPHRRRINTEESAKVVADIWGTEFIQFLGPLAILQWGHLKKRINCTRMIRNIRMNLFYSSSRPSSQ